MCVVTAQLTPVLQRGVQQSTSSGLVHGVEVCKAMTCLSSNVVRSGSSIGLEVGVYVRVTIVTGHVQLLLTLHQLKQLICKQPL